MDKSDFLLLLIEDTIVMLCYAKSLQSCPTLCDPIDGSPPGSAIPGILQARILEWVAISFSNAWKRKVKVKLLTRVRLLATPWTVAFQAPLSMDFPGKSTGVGCHCLLRRRNRGSVFSFFNSTSIPHIMPPKPHSVSILTITLSICRGWALDVSRTGRSLNRNVCN